jgi:tripartite-type tricarboxylate transporter receptor subunit TctC
MRIAIAVLGGLLATPALAADDFPNRPLRVIAPFAPGNAGDIIPRALAPKMSEQFRQNIVIDNRGGAGGTIAAELTKNSPPDGYTVMLVTAGTHAINASLYSKLAYDPVKDFTPIGLCASSPNVLVLNLQVPAQSVKEFIALAKAKPGALNYGSSGSGTTVHLSGELFNVMAGVSTIHVPYKGAGEALTDLIAGRLQFMFASMSSSVQLIKVGKLRALAVTSAKRHPALPDLPAMAEFLPGFEAVAWYGYVGPAGLSKAHVARWNEALKVALQDPETLKRLTAVGVDPLYSTPEEFAAYIKAEVPKWAQVVKASGAKAD